MAFTAYIFKEDYERLTKREFNYASQNQKGGSLFGQWTSTGNPVIHRALSFGQSHDSRDEEVARNLYDGFRVCYIGEWRPVQSYEQNAMQARQHLWRRRESVAPTKFLVLDVSKTGIVPFLLNRQPTPEMRGVLEKLSGENPFNRSDVFRQSQPVVNYSNPPRHGNEAGGAVAAQHWRQDQPQNQEAYTTAYQWYSGEKGTSKLQDVLGKLQEIAQQEKVDMSRDRDTQDITLSFTDKRRARKWEVKFPAQFPSVGAVVIGYQGTTSRPMNEHRIAAGDRNVNTAVSKIVNYIESKTSIY